MPTASTNKASMKLPLYITAMHCDIRYWEESWVNDSDDLLTGIEKLEENEAAIDDD